MKFLKFALLISLTFLFGCNSGDKNADFDKEPMLKNIAYNLAIPAYQESLNNFEKLKQSITNFQKNESSLNDLRSSWNSASVSWAKTAPYRFGPIDDLLIENNFYYFPVDTTKIQSAIANYNQEKGFISSLGSNVQGLGAIEFVLFTNETLNDNQLKFILMLSNQLAELNQEVLTQWENNYAEEFSKNTGSGINSSISKLTNQWIEIADYIKGDEVGRPAGKTVGIDKNIYNLQSPYSQTSLAIIEAKLFALQQSFNGGEKEGVDDYLKNLDIKISDNLPLNEKINNQINTVLARIDSQESLAKMITESSKQVDQIYLESLNLGILLKTELMGQLGLVTTFSDGDGD